jgi:phosphoserine phosphatase
MNTLSKSVHLPLCVDLDGTLLRTDVTQESIFLLLWEKPWLFFALAWWLLKGRAYLKKRLADLVMPVPSRLPINYALLSLLEEEKEKGTPLYLVSAANYKVVRAIADYMGIFDDVFASDQTTNLRGEAKGNFLVHRFGERGYIYAGNSRDDLLVWRYAFKAIAVNTPFNVRAILKRMSLPVEFIKDGEFSWLKMLSLFSPLSLVISLSIGMLFGWHWGLFILCVWSFTRLLHTLFHLRKDTIQSLTNLRIHLLLGHIPLSRAWALLSLLALGIIISLKESL